MSQPPRLRLALIALALLLCLPLVSAGHQGKPGDEAIRQALRDQIQELSDRLEGWRGLHFRQPVDIEVTRGEDRMLAGWYEPRTGRLVVVPERSARFRRGALLHELAHALQDQHFDLSALHHSAQKTQDARRALTALVEGEAMLAVSEIMGYDFSRHARLPKADPIEPTLFEKLFNYGAGMAFVRDLRERGGWQLVDRAYREPPRTTQEILSPQRYPLARIATPEPQPAAGEVVVDRRRGAYELYWLLARHPPTRDDARTLAETLAGDRYRETRLADSTRRAYWDLRLTGKAAAQRLLRRGGPAFEAAGWQARRSGQDVHLRRRLDGVHGKGPDARPA